MSPFLPEIVDLIYQISIYGEKALAMSAHFIDSVEVYYHFVTLLECQCYLVPQNTSPMSIIYLIQKHRDNWWAGVRLPSGIQSYDKNIPPVLNMISLLGINIWFVDFISTVKAELYKFLGSQCRILTDWTGWIRTHNHEWFDFTDNIGYFS